MPVKRELPAKIGRCNENLAGRNFDFRAKSSRDNFFIYIKKKIAAWTLFVTPSYFCWQLAFYRHLPTSGRQNTVKTAPQPLFVDRAFVALYVTIISPLRSIPISVFIFELEAEQLKISVFHQVPLQFGKQVRRPAVDSILMPPTFPIATTENCFEIVLTYRMA